MKKVKVELTGITPLLMNNPASMIDAVSSSMKSKTEKHDIKKEADKLAYKMESGELYVPAAAVKGCLIGASSWKKFGKFTAKPLVAGGVSITPYQIGLGTKKYEVDVRTVVIQRARVVKGRPMVDNWKLNFTLTYNDKLIVGDDLKAILEEGGERVGILDFRPAKLGEFGMFTVSKWQEE